MKRFAEGTMDTLGIFSKTSLNHGPKVPLKARRDNPDAFGLCAAWCGGCTLIPLVLIYPFWCWGYNPGPARAHH